MFKKIIIATDLSAASDTVINCMKDFKSMGVEELILFYAIEKNHSALSADEIRDKVESGLKKQQERIEAQGFNTFLEIATGNPAEELKLISRQKDVSLIVIGSQGETAASHILFRFGSTTCEILHSHEKPLLMLRTKAVDINGQKKIESLCKNLKDRILFTTDFSDISMRAFDYVVRLVEGGCKKVTLFHVQDKIRIGKYLSEKLQEFNRIDNERLEIHKNLLLSKGAKEVKIKIVYGIASKEILAESRSGYSLIVMGSQGRGFFNEIFIGSVSHNVARNADVSILLIPSVDR